MATAWTTHGVDLWTRHQDNIAISVAHRLDVARARDDQRLIELLKQEQFELCHGRSGWLRPLIIKSQKLWSSFLAWLAKGSEVSVQRFQHDGTTWWYAYDPQTGASLYSDSETDVRTWIEAGIYRH